MAGTNPIATFSQTNNTVQTATAYKAAIDGDSMVMQREVDNFAPHALQTPAMYVAVDPGHIFDGTTLTEIGAQANLTCTSGLTAATVDDATGLATGMIITASNLSANTTISTIAGTNITLSAVATASTTVPAVFSQLTGIFTAPGGNPRVDRIVVDRFTGVLSVVTGTPAATPVPPAIPSGKAPVARVLLQTASTSITNSMITDERDMAALGRGLLGELGLTNSVTNGMLAQMATLTVKSNITGGAANAADNGVSAILDAVFGSAQGNILARGASNWAALATGSNGQFLQTQGAAANAQWATQVVGGQANIQTFTSSGTWTKPAGYGSNSRALVQSWGGGASGDAANGSSSPGGGGGGAYVEAWFNLSNLGTTESVTIGAGGAAVVGIGHGHAGGDTSFGSHVTAPGAPDPVNTSTGGQGGGWGPFDGAGAGQTINGVVFTTASDGYNEGGGGGNNNNPGGNSVWGGGGGGGASNAVGGNSQFGGDGGTGSLGGTGGAGAQPGGGGGASGNNHSGAGGPGQVVVTVFNLS